jgi:hypothetical protein
LIRRTNRSIRFLRVFKFLGCQLTLYGAGNTLTSITYMKSKILFLATVFCLFSISSYAQFRQSIGASAVLGTGKIPEGAEFGYA